MRTSFGFAKGARDTGKDFLEKYEGKEHFKCRAIENGENMRGRYEEKEKIDEFKIRGLRQGNSLDRKWKVRRIQSETEPGPDHSCAVYIPHHS